MSGKAELTIQAEKPGAEHSEEILKDNPTAVHDILPDWGRPSWKVSHLIKLNLLLVCPFLSAIYNGFDNSLLNGLQSVPQWRDYFGHPAGARLGAVANGILYGNIMALPFAAYICDRFGRKNALIFSSSIVLVGVAVQSASQDFAMLIVGRFILGFGVLISITAAPLLIAESAYPSHRPYMTGVSQCLYGFGGIIASWTTYGTSLWNNNSNWKWRLPILLQVMFPVFQLIMLIYVPESPRYWVSRGKIDKAKAFLLKYHAGGNEEIGGQLVEFEIAEICFTLEAEKNREGISWLEFFKTKANRRRLLIACFIPYMTQFSGNAVLGYFLNLVLDAQGITSSTQQLVLNGGINIFNFGISLFSVIFVEYVGRRRMFLWSACGMLLIYVIWTILSAQNQMQNFKNKSLSSAVLSMIFLYWFTYVMGMLAVPTIYITEVLPFHLRAKGYVLNQLVLSGILLFNGFVTPIAMAAISWKYYIVYCVSISIEIVVIYFFFPETKGLSLEEVSKVFGEHVLPFDFEESQREPDIEA